MDQSRPALQGIWPKGDRWRRRQCPGVPVGHRSHLRCATSVHVQSLILGVALAHFPGQPRRRRAGFGDRCGQSSMVSRTRSVIVAEGSSRANMTVRSKPSGPVISTRTPPRKGSAAIPPSLRLSDVLPGGLDGRLDAIPPGRGDPLAIEDGQRHRRLTLPTTRGTANPIVPSTCWCATNGARGSRGGTRTSGRCGLRAGPLPTYESRLPLTTRTDPERNRKDTFACQIRLRPINGKMAGLRSCFLVQPVAIRPLSLENNGRSLMRSKNSSTPPGHWTQGTLPGSSDTCAKEHMPRDGAKI